MSESLAQIKPKFLKWQWTETDQHLRIDGPGVSFACKFPEQMVKAGNSETRFWHMGSFDLIQTAPDLWEITQETDQSSVSVVIPAPAGLWMAQKLEEIYSKR